MAEEPIKEPQVNKRTECPYCGFAEVYVGELADKAKEDGTLDPTIDFYARVSKGSVPSPEMIQKLPAGTKFYVYFIGEDVCKRCHAMYARVVSIGEGVKPVAILTRADINPN